jgi:hypothetical protein
MKNETLHLVAGFNNIKHILTNQSCPPNIHCMEKRELSAQPQEVAGNFRHTVSGSSQPHPSSAAVEPRMATTSLYPPLPHAGTLYCLFLTSAGSNT